MQNIDELCQIWSQIFIFDFAFSLYRQGPNKSSPQTNYVKNKRAVARTSLLKRLGL